MNREPLAVGQLASLVEKSMAEVGVTEVPPNTPWSLLLTVAGWDRLLLPSELDTLKLVVSNLTPFTVLHE